jgi:hypothetical protein
MYYLSQHFRSFAAKFKEQIMAKKYELGLSLDNIISGDSEEAHEIMKELGWISDPLEDNDHHDKRTELCLIMMLSLTMAWISYLFFSHSMLLILGLIGTWFSIIYTIYQHFINDKQVL